MSRKISLTNYIGLVRAYSRADIRARPQVIFTYASRENISATADELTLESGLGSVMREHEAYGYNGLDRLRLIPCT